MKNRSSKVVLVALALALAGCETPPTKEQTGAIAGGVIGGAVGGQIGGSRATIIIGTLAGVFIGSQIGRSMAEADRQRAAAALETYPTGASSTWVNPDTGNSYTVTPTRTYASNTGPCREFTTQAIIGGKPQEIYGTACRQPDGSWKTM